MTDDKKRLPHPTVSAKREQKQSALIAFIRESNMIEGILREPAISEVRASSQFLELESMTVAAICHLQAMFAPGKPLRKTIGMNVRVGGYTAPYGGETITDGLDGICADANAFAEPWSVHVAFERLHPFMDGNGRAGRMLWAWMMQKRGIDPFALSFLHRFYYQTLDWYKS